MTHSLTDGLTSALSRAGIPGPQGLERLSGGANMESWLFRAGDGTYVLRRSPAGFAVVGGRAIDYATEANLIRAAAAAGVTAPVVIVELIEEDSIGAGFVMEALPGTADPAVILAEADPAVLIAEIGRELAATHAIPLDAAPSLPTLVNAEAVAQLRERFLGYGGDRPVLALALRWLEANLPPPVKPVLVHGDFRLGNLLVDVDGNAATSRCYVSDMHLSQAGKDELTFATLGDYHDRWERRDGAWRLVHRTKLNRATIGSFGVFGLVR